MVQKGDVVELRDHSGHVSLLPSGKPTHTGACGGIYSNDRLIVVETVCKFPYEGDVQPNNDTLLWNVTKGYYVFVRAEYLRVIGKTCPECGSTLRY